MMQMILDETTSSMLEMRCRKLDFELRKMRECGCSVKEGIWEVVYQIQIFEFGKGPTSLFAGE